MKKMVVVVVVVVSTAMLLVLSSLSEAANVENAVHVKSTTRLQIKHRYYDEGRQYTISTSNTESSVSGVLSRMLDDVRRVEGARVDTIVNTVQKQKKQKKWKKQIQKPKQSRVRTPLRSGIVLGTGNYVIQVGLGTPARALTMVVDTGSDLAWTQCKPCDGPSACYPQNDPIFEPSQSASYKPVQCSAAVCKVVVKAMSGSGCSVANICGYTIQYLDGSETSGDVATDALTLGHARIPSFAFGCGHVNQGLFYGFDGLLGFSRNPLAFPAQTKSTLFTYCLPPPSAAANAPPGFLEFGPSSSTPSSSAPGTSAPLLPSDSGFYIVSLPSAVVASHTISGGSGSLIIVDSGTVITRLDSALYAKVRDEFRRGLAGVARAPPDAGRGIFDTCYSPDPGSELTIPAVTLVLGSSLRFSPPPSSLVYPVDSNGTFCFAFAPIQSSSGVPLSILGNYQQQGFSFSFNLARDSLSIKSNAC